MLIKAISHVNVDYLIVTKMISHVNQKHPSHANQKYPTPTNIISHANQTNLVAILRSN